MALAWQAAIACRLVSDPAALFIAIVDDNELHCRSLDRLVRRAGFDAMTFRSAEEFLAAPQRGSFNCLLLDVQLVGISGIALHRRLRAEGDLTPVIYITAHDDPARRTEALSIGCAGFFLKTDASSAIIQALRRATSTP
jgi:FixJ family two-component response regulator